VFRRTTKFILDIFGSALAGAAILVALLSWRLAGEPVSLAFLTPYLQDALRAEDGSFRFELEDTVLTWAGWERTLDIRLVGVKAIGPEGDILAAVPELSVSLSVRAMMRGIVAPTSIDVLRPRIDVFLSREGKFELDLGEGEGDDILHRVLTDLLSPLNNERSMGYLTRVSILNSSVVVDDRRLETTWRANNTDIILTRNETGIQGEVALDLDVSDDKQDAITGAETGPRQEAHFDLEFAYDTAAERVDLGASFSEINPGLLAARAKLLAPFRHAALPVSGTLTVSMDLDGRIPFFGFDFSGTAGKLVVPGLYDDGVAVQQAALRGRFENDMAKLFLDDVFIDVGGTTLNASGELLPDGEDARLHVDAVVNHLLFDEFGRYWPKSLAEPSRNWVTTHMSLGAIREARATFSMHLPGGDFSAVNMKSVTGKLGFNGLSIDFLSPMPPASELAGTAIFTHNRIDFNVSSGRIGPLAIEDSIVSLWDLDTDIEKARVEAVVRGTARDLLSILDEEPLGAARYLGIDPQKVGGEMAGRAVFDFPLRTDLDMPMVTISAAANLVDVTLPGLVQGKDVTQGDLSIKVTKDTMDVEGSAVFEGVPAQLAGIEHFTDDAPFISRYTVTSTLDEEARRRLGLDTRPYLTGPVGVELIWTELDGSRGDLSIAANLNNASLDLALLEWTKPPESPGTARVSLALEDHRLTKMRSFSITAEDLDVGGEAVFTPDGKELRNITFDRLKTGRNDFKSTVGFRSDGGYDITLSGPALDVSHLFDDDDPDEKPLPPLSLSVHVDRLWVKPEGGFDSVSGLLQNQDDSWRTLFIDADMKGKGHAVFRILPEGRNRRLTLTSNNAGELLRQLDFYPNMESGALELSGKIDDSKESRPFSGELEISNYNIIKAPVLARMLTLASLTGIASQMKGEKGIAFEKFSAPFSYENKLVRIRDGEAVGSSVGITFKGVLDFAKDVSELDGTLVPAYLLNSIWGKIPILGQLLTGEEKGGGMFAATFHTSGPIGHPDVSINPLAALTPGVLRNLFGIFGGGSEYDSGEKTGEPSLQSTADPFGAASIPKDTADDMEGEATPDEAGEKN